VCGCNMQRACLRPTPAQRRCARSRVRACVDCG
jgi:hypothetical protein